MKINFTKEHLAALKANIAELVLRGTIIPGPVGQSYDIFNIVNTLSTTSLRTISAFLQKKKAGLSVDDEWVENPHKAEVEELQFVIDTISLVIGYKLKNIEIEDNLREKARLEKQLNELKESQKTPAELIAELEAKITAIES